MIKVRKVICIFAVISLIGVAILSIPVKPDEKEIKNRIQYETNELERYIEANYSEMPEERKEEIRQSRRENIEKRVRSSYKSSGTFSSRYWENLKAYGIGLGIVIIGMMVTGMHYAERRRR